MDHPASSQVRRKPPYWLLWAAIAYSVVGSALWVCFLLAPHPRPQLAERAATWLAFPWGSLYGILALLTVGSPMTILLAGLHPVGITLNAFLIYRFIGRRMRNVGETRSGTIEPRERAHATSQGPLAAVVAAWCLIPAQFVPSLIMAAAIASDARTGQWARLGGGLLYLILQAPLSTAGLVLSVYLLLKRRVSRTLPGGLLLVVSAMFLVTDLGSTLSRIMSGWHWLQ